jgi:hypothetical protein
VTAAATWLTGPRMTGFGLPDAMSTCARRGARATGTRSWRT